MSLHYLVREPKIKLEKNPALVLLHGYGSNEEDLFSFASE
jgi:phospholipase/carboxylesterase